MTKGKRKKTSVNRQEQYIRFAIALVVIGLGIVALFRFGVIGVFLDQTMRVLLGTLSPAIHIIIIYCAIRALINHEILKQPVRFWMSVGLILLAVILFSNLILLPEKSGMIVLSDFVTQIPVVFKDSTAPSYAGIIGAFFFGTFSYLLGREGTLVFAIIFMLLGIALLVTPSKLLEGAEKQGQKTRSFFGQWQMKRAMKLEQKKKAKQAKQLKEQETNDVLTLDSLIESNYEEQYSAGFISLDAHDIPKSERTSSTFINADEDLSLSAERPKVLETHKPDENPFGLDNAGLDPVSVSDRTVVQEVLEKSDDFRPDSYTKYRLPSTNLLEVAKGASRSTLNDQSAKEKGRRLLDVLKQFGIDAELLNIHIGPAITQFEIKPDSSVKISKISSIQDNLMMELAVKTLRIEAPIPGRNAVGIEIPNVEMIPVRMKDVILAHRERFFDDANINVALGKNLKGDAIVVQLNKMPHLLVAGATGSGKSVCMNTIISSILLTKKPDELKLLLIDPKKVEFTPYTEIPHLIGPVISDPNQASNALKVVVDEMDSRYETFSKVGVRNIGSYNEKVKQHPEDKLTRMPWIVVIIDELADLMAVAGKDVEASIQRITQLARAAGIHLIVATQRPSVDVVTGIIKANIPSRIAFAVSSAVDSRTILDASGAEKLLGYGDMLYIPMGEPNTTRVQGCYMSDNEVHDVANRASEQAKPRFADAFIQLDGVDGNQGVVDVSDDPLYEEARTFVIQEKRASTSLLQRRFRIGYNRAANIIDELETAGIIGPAQGSKPRDVLISES